MSPEQRQPPPVAPRTRKPGQKAADGPVQSPHGTNGTNGTDPRTALTHAIEDLHAAAKALRLPPMRVDWQQPDPDLDAPDAETKALQAHVATFLSDMEGARVGPVTWPLNEITPPERPHDFLVENLIRPGTTVMLAGPPGAAKSWASRQLALTCATGRPMYLDRYAVAKRLNVLVVDEDNGPDEEWRREESLMAYLELRRDQLANVRRVSLEGVQLEHESWQRWLRGQIRAHDLDLVILDPISEMHGGKELREDPAFRSMLAFLKRLKVDFPRLATIVVHHTRKRDPKAGAGQATLEDVRGQWGQTPDVVAMLVPLGDRRSKWEVHKRVPHSSLVLEQVEQGQTGEGALRMVADESTQRTRAMANDARVIDAIRDGLETFPDIQEALAMPKATLHRVLKRLVMSRTVAKAGDRYSVPEDGD